VDRYGGRITGASGAIIVVLFLVMSRIEGLTDRTGLFLLIFGAVFTAYAAALTVWFRTRARLPLFYVFVVALLGRAVLVPAVPVMSTDIYRYLWEGRVTARGSNPFLQPPDSPELEPLRDRYYDGVSHKHMQTIYPPFSQLVFALAAWVKPVPQVQKLFFVLFDLGVVLLLTVFLRTRGRDPGDSIVYAWNPLVIFESAHSGHVDTVGLFFLLLSLWLLAREKVAAGFVSLGLSFLSKYLAVILAPYFLRRRKYAVWLAVFLGVVVAGYLPFAGAGAGLWASLKTYSQHWQFNGLWYELAAAVTGDRQWIRVVLLLALGGVVAYRVAVDNDVLRYAFVVIGAVLLLAPTLYPWYVTWIVPFLCFFPNRAWILFTGLVFLSYRVWAVSAAGGGWELPWYVYAAEYVPFYGLLLFDAARRRRVVVPA
jgi:hypothetical protein